MATSYTATFSGAVKPSAPAMFDTDQALNPTGMLQTGLGQEVGKADGTQLTPFHVGGIGFFIRVETDGNPNTP
jgi:hypothetical protein